MTTIEHEGLDCRYDIPVLTQGRIEDFYRERKEILAGMEPVSTEDYVEELTEFIQSIAKADLSGPQFKAVLREFREGMVTLQRGSSEPTGAESNGAVVRAMARLGWLEGVGEEDVPGMKPSEVLWLAREIDNLIDEAFSIPKN